MSKKITVSKAIGEALHEEMLRDEKVFIMGEDMAVMGNVFAITKGFLEEFGPNRVIDTPISEEGFVGMAVGAAMRGLRPVVELMYDDFATECADPLFNQAAKIRYMTGGQCSVPMVLRAPMGAGRRNAGQHSQCLENFFCHFPGLKVVAPCTAADAKGLLKSAIRSYPEMMLLILHDAANDIIAQGVDARNLLHIDKIVLARIIIADTIVVSSQPNTALRIILNTSYRRLCAFS